MQPKIFLLDPAKKKVNHINDKKCVFISINNAKWCLFTTFEIIISPLGIHQCSLQFTSMQTSSALICLEENVFQGCRDGMVITYLLCRHLHLTSDPQQPHKN